MANKTDSKPAGAEPLPVYHCQLCNAPAVLATTRDIRVTLDAKKAAFVAVGFRLPGQASDAPALCPACQVSLLQLAAETAAAQLEK